MNARTRASADDLPAGNMQSLSASLPIAPCHLSGVGVLVAQRRAQRHGAPVLAMSLPAPGTLSASTVAPPRPGELARAQRHAQRSPAGTPADHPGRTRSRAQRTAQRHPGTRPAVPAPPVHPAPRASSAHPARSPRELSGHPVTIRVWITVLVQSSRLTRSRMEYPSCSHPVRSATCSPSTTRV